MSLPILQPSYSAIPPQIRGDVTIDPSVIVASGVILNATPGTKIIIHAGVCLGMGTIITAHGGNVEVEANAILGPGSLILGKCVIGSQASLGTSVTVYNAEVDKLAVISAGSIIGDHSRKLDVNENQEQVIVIDEVHQEIAFGETKRTQTTEIEEEAGKENQVESSSDNIIDKINRLNQNNYSRKSKTSSTTEKTEQPAVKQKPDISYKENQKGENVEKATSSVQEKSNQVKSQEEDKSSESVSPEKVVKTETSVESKPSSQAMVKNQEVVGKVYINRLLYTLFPHRNSDKS